MTLIEQYNLHNDFGKTIGMHFEIIEPGLVHYFLTVKQKNNGRTNLSDHYLNYNMHFVNSIMSS